MANKIKKIENMRQKDKRKKNYFDIVVVMERNPKELPVMKKLKFNFDIIKRIF